ncbi:hypothetical protein [Bradyrhizobium sp. CCGE-LA001]|uniref:hypothetical protein n=1 Tax=Bradyrhizobium sp. CCGE-LA001 TaxID=1223566 RepID=UPI0002F204B4|nr:hypothetical protein [Bradyrhizobium sp. CCGE-LA001]
MRQSLLTEILEILLSALWDTIVRSLGLENLVEIVTAIVGLSCIVIGFTVYMLGY